MIKGFNEFQYGTLNPANRVHASIIKRLEKVGPYKGLIRAVKGPKDKDKDKEKEKEYARPLISKKDLEVVYSMYPRKEGKSKGLEKAAIQIKTNEDLLKLKEAVIAYKEKLERDETPREFVKHFDTFMTSWRDCLDPDYGSTETFVKKKPQQRIFTP